MMYLSLTFDYEIFFGDNFGTYDEVLFSPTYKLIDMLETKNVSATFFADVCSIPIAKKYNQISYVNGFTKQLQYMKQHGQDIQLHIHSHWLNSEYRNGQWFFSSKGYRLHDFGNNIDTIIHEGVSYLNDTISAIDSNYKCVAYRAGGFCIQPHEVIVKKLYDNGIRVDSSIAPQLFAKSDAHYYDYRHRLENVNWCVSDAANWWQNCNEGKHLLEIPIATIDKPVLSFAFKRFFSPNSIKLNLGPKRGSYIKTTKIKANRFKSYYEYLTGYNTISMDAYSAKQLYSQTERFYKKNKCDNQVIAIIGHPKLVNEKYIDNLSAYIDTIKKDKRFELISIYDAYCMKEKIHENI